MKELFEKIILLGRPASGKSEVIHYVKNLNLDERKKRFHLGKIKDIDDFPMLWTWFEEDDILEKKFGKPNNPKFFKKKKNNATWEERRPKFWNEGKPNSRLNQK